MSKLLRCWWLHRRLWTIIRPGILPLQLDALYWCPICDRGPRYPVPVGMARAA